MTVSLIGPYQLLDKLGEGGMGSVYEAIHQGIGRHVAIKLLSSQFAANGEIVARFFNEARAAARIDHPGIVQIFDCGQLPDGTPYLVMEVLKGESLAARLQRGGLSLMQVLQVGWQISSALAAAHEVGIVHRDLKPENIMLVPDQMLPDGERVKVLDFGIAKLSQSGGAVTSNNVIMGTPRYMSPEQCRGAAGVTDRADVYSLGVLLFEMLARRPMFEVDSPNAYLFLHVTDFPPHLSSVSPAIPVKIGDLVHRLLAKQPAMRPRMIEVATELRALGERSEPLSWPALSANTPVVEMTPTKISSLTTFALTSGDVAVPQIGSLTTFALTSGDVAVRNKSPRQFPLRKGLAVVLASGVLLGLAQPWRAVSRWTRPARQVAQPATAPVPITELPSAVAVPTAVRALTSPEPNEPQAQVAQTPPPVPQVLWQIESEPPGAAVVGELGTRLGTTPWTQEQPMSDGVTKLRLRLPGYRDQHMTLMRDHDERRTEHLKPVSKPALASSMRITDKPDLHVPTPQKSVLDDVD